MDISLCHAFSDRGRRRSRRDGENMPADQGADGPKSESAEKSCFDHDLSGDHLLHPCGVPLHPDHPGHPEVCNDFRVSAYESARSYPDPDDVLANSDR